MKKSIKIALAGLLAIPVLSLGLVLTTPTTSVNAKQVCADGQLIEDTDVCLNPVKGINCIFGTDCAFTKLVNAALYIIGAISVLMLIYGGIRYTISGGSDSNVKAAKDTIMYAVIGIVVALLAYAIVNYVLSIFKL